MQNRFDIPFQHWSMRVGRPNPRTGEMPPFWGEIVAGVDDLDQSIANLILTPLGTVPTEPFKGCDVYPWLDRTPDVAIPNMTPAIWDALSMWEPRIIVQDVTIEETAFVHFTCKVFWRPIESVFDDLRITEVAFGSNPSQQATLQ